MGGWWKNLQDRNAEDWINNDAEEALIKSGYCINEPEEYGWNDIFKIQKNFLKIEKKLSKLREGPEIMNKIQG